MQIASRSLSVLVLLAAVCGSASLGAQRAGGTIAGSVRGPGSEHMLVEVPGSSATAVTDATGAFVLLDVPEGTSFLRVSGGSANATLRIRAMVSTEYRRMTVSVAGTVAREIGEQTETEFHGTIDAIDAATKVVTIVNGTASRKVMVTDATVIKERGAVVGFDALAKGQRVEVRGTLQADGTVAARGIRIHTGSDGRGDDSNGIALVGTLNAVDGARLTVDGLAVDASKAEIDKGDTRITVADLHLGDHLLVRGVVQADNSIVASRIRVLAAEGEPEDLHVAGKVTAVDAPGKTFTIGETRIAVDDRSAYEGRGFHSLADLKVGDFVDAEVVKLSDGTLLAKEVRRVSRRPPAEITIRGPVGAVDAANGSVVIGDTTLTVTAQTTILRGQAAIKLADLVLGEPAVAKAIKTADGRVVALSIMVSLPPAPGTPVEIRGTIDAIGSDGLTVAGKRFLVDATTVIRRGDVAIKLSDLKLGEPAEVHATTLADGRLLARKIQVRRSR